MHFPVSSFEIEPGQSGAGPGRLSMADSPLPPWGPIHKVHTGGRAGPGLGRAGSQWALESPGPKNSFGWAHVNKTTYSPVFYTAPCVKCLMRASALPGPTPRNALARIKHFTHGAVYNTGE
jgi:hypothetical protein